MPREANLARQETRRSWYIIIEGAIGVGKTTLARMLRDLFAGWGLPETDVIGPAPPFFARLRGRYRWQVLLRHANPAELLRAVEIPPGWRVDVDPAGVL